MLPRRAIFDRLARQSHRDRADPAVLAQVEEFVAELLIDRLDTVSRSFATALVINTGTGVLAEQLATRGIRVSETDYAPNRAAARRAEHCAEDALSAMPDTHDLVICPWGLDTVDDLPGALILARRALRPGGLFLAAMIGAPTLTVLRRIVSAADVDAHVARLHPLVDVRAAGDLLVRAGFALPVADLETQTLAYRDLDRLVADLRAAGSTNSLAERHAIGRGWQARAKAAFAAQSDTSGRVIETVSLIVLTGWSETKV